MSTTCTKGDTHIVVRVIECVCCNCVHVCVDIDVRFHIEIVRFAESRHLAWTDECVAMDGIHGPRRTTATSRKGARCRLWYGQGECAPAFMVSTARATNSGAEQNEAELACEISLYASIYT